MGLIKASPEREKRTIHAMLRLYCKDQHGKTELCPDCGDLLEYAKKRIDHCVFGQEKPACKECPVHCYSIKKREEVREVMRYSGPRMIYRHPVMAIYHILK